jgi:transcriptional regulator with XRE-family HTH domain
MNSYYQLIAFKRHLLGKSQAELAEVLNYSVQAVAKYEKGQAEISVYSLIPLCRFLQIDPDSFLKGTDAKNYDLADNRDFNKDLFVKNIHNARAAAGLSIDKLARKAEVSDRSIKNYEQGKSFPSLSVFSAILAATGQTAATFLFEEIQLPALLLKSQKQKRLVLFIVLGVCVTGGGATGIVEGVRYAQKTPDSNNSVSSVILVESDSSSPAGNNSVGNSSIVSSSFSSQEASASSSGLTTGPVAKVKEATVLIPGTEYTIVTEDFTYVSPSTIKASYAYYNLNATIQSSSVSLSFYLPYAYGNPDDSYQMRLGIYDFSKGAYVGPEKAYAIQARVIPSDKAAVIAKLKADIAVYQSAADDFDVNVLSKSSDAYNQILTEGKSAGYINSKGNFTSSAPASFIADYNSKYAQLASDRLDFAEKDDQVNERQADVDYLTTLL